MNGLARVDGLRWNPAFRFWQSLGLALPLPVPTPMQAHFAYCLRRCRSECATQRSGNADRLRAVPSID